MKEYWTSLASLLGVLAFCQSLLHSLFPPELRFFFLNLTSRFFTSLFSSSYLYFDITEIDGVNTNELYNAVQLYLSSSPSSSSPAANRLSLTRSLNSSSVTFGLSNNDSISDSFNGAPVLWEHVVTQRNSQSFSWRPLPDEKRGFTLRIRKIDKPIVLDSYIDYIMDRAAEIRRRNQDRLLYTNSRGGSLDARGHPWESVPFKHPSTFDTLAMDPAKKLEIMNDLKDFALGQEFYQRTGRAWKRGYLLYGPPGTGKSSMIAAMANFLGYDIYDLELTEVHNNSELRKLLMKTSSKSIIVIEDIDCSINLGNRKKSNRNSSCYFESAEMRIGGGAGGGAGSESEGGGNSITLSGLLNFTDGLWSCCGSERIFVFTTNHVEKLDPALLRSGRMDMHIFMSYCSFPALKILLKNYLGFRGDGDEEEGSNYGEVLRRIEEVIEKAEMTPADVSEVLIKNRRDSVKAVGELLEMMKQRAEKNGGGGGGGGKRVEEEEEQEKRALVEEEGFGCDYDQSIVEGEDRVEEEEEDSLGKKKKKKKKNGLID